MDTQEINAAIVVLQDAHTALYDAIENDTAAVYALEDAKAQAISDGLIVGKNAEEREAKAATILQEQIGRRRVTEADVRYKRMKLERATLNYERVKYTIRLMEAINNAV
jgi:hypothetical protein